MNQKELAEKVQKELLKKHDNMPVVYDAEKLINRKRNVISVSPAIDLAIGGGIMEGTWTIISGQPKAGKTLSAMQIAKNAQSQYGKFVYYVSIESRIKRRDILGIPGFNKDLCKIIQSEKGCILTAEDFLNDTMLIMKTHPGCVIILDSVSALCSSDEFSKDITSTGRANGPKLLASFCRQMAGVVPANDITVIMIQHLIANTSGYGQPYIEDGGQKIKYQFDTKIRCKGVQKWLETDKTQVGNILTWEVLGSPLSAPGKTCESYVKFGYGIDAEMELVTVGTELGLLSRSGAWYALDFMKDNPDFSKQAEAKFCGQEAVKVFLAENPKVKEYLFERIKELS